MSTVAETISQAAFPSVTLSDVAVIEKARHEGELQYVGLEDVSNATGEFLGPSEPRAMKSTTFHFTNEHVLYGRLRPYLNKALLPDFEGHCSSEIFPIRPSKDLDRRYLFYWLTWPETCSRISATATGARMPRANMKEVLAFEIPLPPLDEQKRIVAVLDQAFAALDRARAKVETNLDDSANLFDSWLADVFHDHPISWNTEKLRDLCDRITVGHVGPMAKRYVNQGTPFLRSQNVRPFRISLEDVKFIDDRFRDELTKSELRPGDVAIVRTGYPGTAAVIPDSLPLANCSDLVIARTKTELRSILVYERLKEAAPTC